MERPRCFADPVTHKCPIMEGPCPCRLWSEIGSLRAQRNLAFFLLTALAVAVVIYGALI